MLSGGKKKKKTVSKGYILYDPINITFFGGGACRAACGILIPWPGIKPMPPYILALEAWDLNPGPPEKSQYNILEMTWL